MGFNSLLHVSLFWYRLHIHVLNVRSKVGVLFFRRVLHHMSPKLFKQSHIKREVITIMGDWLPEQYHVQDTGYHDTNSEKQ
ncbi:hypothetical protein D3C80_1730270 [compost metagenome]